LSTILVDQTFKHLLSQWKFK